MAGNAAKDQKTRLINERHVMLGMYSAAMLTFYINSEVHCTGIRTDDELGSLCPPDKVIFPSAGTTPFIHSALTKNVKVRMIP